MPYFLPFREILRDQLNPRLIGGKASTLVKLYQNKFLVPDGFIITTEFFSYFLEENCISENSVKIVDNLLSTRFSDEDIEKIYYYTDRCSPDSPVAVRSSASVEDSDRRSFAGQFESFLETKRSFIPEAIIKCWQSLYSPRAYKYSKDSNIGKMAVIVQKMIYPEISGVAFSLHPVTNDSNSIAIEAVPGSNKLLVGGAITPDCYILNKQFKILDKQLVLGRNVMHENEQTLSDDQIVAVARIVIDVERFFNKPVDIEWALIDRNIYILQSRPITTN